MSLKFSVMIVLKEIESEIFIISQKEIFIISQKSMNKVMTGKRTSTKD
jgi:hypothetical protein